MIGRTIRVLEGNPRFVISVFYPASGGASVSGIDLYAPCQAEAAAVLTEMGVNLDNLNITSVITTSESLTIKKGRIPRHPYIAWLRCGTRYVSWDHC